MTPLDRDILEAPSGYRSRDVALFLAQLDDQNRRLIRDLDGITPRELAWQPAPGMNTIGMLLAHIAIVEAFWVQIGLVVAPFDCPAVLGIGEDDDGMPLADAGTPPVALAGKDASFYLGLLERARAHTKKQTAGLEEADLAQMVRRRRRSGIEEEFNKRWVLYHVLEHEAGHYGQVLLLRHHYRTSSRA